tara:strand:- start:158 stop:310 length:153 start_codon:yes stop_codon:yes gene_type:complete
VNEKQDKTAKATPIANVKEPWFAEALIMSMAVVGAAFVGALAAYWTVRLW